MLRLVFIRKASWHRLLCLLSLPKPRFPTAFQVGKNSELQRRQFILESTSAERILVSTVLDFVHGTLIANLHCVPTTLAFFFRISSSSSDCPLTTPIQPDSHTIIQIPPTRLLPSRLDPSLRSCIPNNFTLTITGHHWKRTYHNLHALHPLRLLHKSVQRQLLQW